MSQFTEIINFSPNMISLPLLMFVIPTSDANLPLKYFCGKKSGKKSSEKRLQKFR